MGLDMYLQGRKFQRTDWSLSEAEREATTRKEDGFKVSQIELDIGYWRKHPDLHGFIVENFADGVDECQEIDLVADDLRKILDAVGKDELPHTTGFFFGSSGSPGDPYYDEEKKRTLQVLTDAIAWLTTDDPENYRSVFYRASW